MDSGRPGMLERGLERARGQVGERVRAHDGALQLLDVPGVERGHGTGLLREDVERVARHARLLDKAVEHALGDRRAASEQVAAVGREDGSARGRTDTVTGAADPAAAQTRRSAAGANLHHEVHRTHVNAELEATRVAMMAGNRPSLSISSTTTAVRCSRKVDPWWARF